MLNINASLEVKPALTPFRGWSKPPVQPVVLTNENHAIVAWTKVRAVGCFQSNFALACFLGHPLHGIRSPNQRFGLIRNKSVVHGGLTFARTKVSKSPRRVVQSAFCKKNFLENLAVVICELIALTPKNAHQQREMIWAFLQCFLQKLFQQTAIHHFTACLFYVKVCACK